MTIPASSFITRADGLVEASVADLRVVLNEQALYFGLNEIGQRIWDHLAKSWPEGTPRWAQFSTRASSSRTISR